MKISKLIKHFALSAALLYVSGFLVAAENPALIKQFWATTSDAERLQVAQQLVSIADVDTLYEWLKQGPEYSADVPTGQQESIRISDDGMRFPYVYLIPEEYDPSRKYPVEFMLHGGVSRPEWEPGGGWWRRGFDSLKQEDRIIVVPASWVEAFWWHENQAVNLPAILNILKGTYNIDENRVTMTGISDGGTGAYFFAFKQPTPWAAFLPYIGHPGVLRNPQSGGGYRLYFENLMAKPLYIVNGENDRLYPSSSLQPFIDVLIDTGVDHIWKVIPEGGHNTNWLPEEAPLIEQFKRDNPRDPLPDSIKWVADRTDKFQRNMWIRIDELSQTPGLLEISRSGNEIEVIARGIGEFTLLLNPEEVDFSRAIRVNVNGETKFEEKVDQDSGTLLSWAARDLDRSMLFTAELNLSVE
ncbi:MAG: hypothetical protein OXU66_07600 [Gammaproteobacteria bacterium]|nr:hypothetical protein [Gammaproteobacteria bacterium]MDD9895863.1 hypothetical protein [Gammaproteobacteria bacterium]MDD9958790.1 hypothetical protein [Gammaproteobacteria bacterium]